MKLRTHVNLIVGCLSAAFVALVISAELDSSRRAIREEIAASNMVAAQVLKSVLESYSNVPSQALVTFLESLGRVRANEISLYASNGQLLYRSPGPTYKAGREAPQWFEKLLLPTTSAREFALQDGARLVVVADASRAILDGWDDMFDLLIVGALALAVLNGLVFWWVSRALSPLPVIAAGLSRLRQGELTFRLPTLRGAEARVIGLAFNDMAIAMEEKVHTERHAREVEARLDERREMAQAIEQRLEEERRMIARELHDEFAQSVTAIRSLAMSISAQAPKNDSTVGEAATLIATEAASLYDAMHGLIPRLVPLTLDTLGLAATLESFVADWRKRNPALTLSLRQNCPPTLGPSIALAIYRIVQEAVINSLRHGHPTTIDVSIDCAKEQAVVRVADDGIGLPIDWARPGCFGLRGLQERVEKLHGVFKVSNRHSAGNGSENGRGAEVVATIPIQAAMQVAQ